VPNAFKPTSEPSCSAAVPQLLGGGPEFSADLTGIMNRIVISPFLVQVWSWAPDGINRLNPGSTYTSNQRLRDRQRQNLFLRKHLLFAGNALSYPSNGPVLEE
jgi:hypothetical protein